MRAHEFINEGKKGSVPKRHSKAQPGAYKFMDNGTDRTYHLNQIMKAVAMADGSSTKALKMDDESFAGKNNVAYPYSELEHNMMQQAFNTVSPTNAHKMIPSNRSMELDSVNKNSPIKPRKDYRKK
jgi:hypothetical protein